MGFGSSASHTGVEEVTYDESRLGSPIARSALLQRAGLALACLVVSAAVIPRWLCGCGADAAFDGEVAWQAQLGKNLAATIVARPERQLYQTGASRFDGQSAIAAYQMAILALGQLTIAHPERRGEYLPVMLAAADRLVDPATLDYAAKVYGQHGVVQMGPGEGHAYLGYINLALGMLRLVEPDNRHAKLHDRLTAALADRLERSPRGLIETYPGETWPPDVAAVAGSIGLHASATGLDRKAMLDIWATRFEACAIDASGYLVQRVRTGTCEPMDAPRGSGTAVGSYFIAFAHERLSRRLYQAIASGGTIDVLGFSGVREYSTGHSGSGDGNSGPILFGVSVGATGFALGAARMHGDRDLFRRLYRSAYLFGAPFDLDDRRVFVIGGILGNALLAAMLTARRP